MVKARCPIFFSIILSLKGMIERFILERMFVEEFLRRRFLCNLSRDGLGRNRMRNYTYQMTAGEVGRRASVFELY